MRKKRLPCEIDVISPNIDQYRVSDSINCNILKTPDSTFLNISNTHFLVTHFRSLLGRMKDFNRISKSLSIFLGLGPSSPSIERSGTNRE